MSAHHRAAADGARFEKWLAHARSSGDQPAVPAATVVVLRDTESGPQTLMLRKNSRIAFGGMWVFPGGRIDAEDYSADGDVVAAARTAAVREAAEEAQVSLDPTALVLFAHWIPPPIAPKRFATWFFAGRVTDSHAVIDDGEIVDMAWITPAGCLERHHDGEIELVPPTWVTLHTLRGFASVGDALAALAARPPRHHATKVARGGAAPTVLWHGDAGYETGDATVAGGRHRLVMATSGYAYDDSGLVDG